MNTYLAFWRGRKVTVHAETSYKAQLAAAAEFKARKAFEVVVVLCEKDGATVTHSTGEF